MEMTGIHKYFRGTWHRSAVAFTVVAALCASTVTNAETEATTSQPVPGSDGSIGYVLTDLIWATYQTPDAKAECPEGLNHYGPRQVFEVLYPENRERTLLDTQLKYEIETWYPRISPDSFPTDRFPFREVGGPLSYGLNLDGEVGPEDFTHPDGMPGIDNQLYRATGCLVGYRGPDGLQWIFLKHAIRQQTFSRLMIELTGVDDLANDPEVQVTLYRGTDRLLTDASGTNIMPGATQRIDIRWGLPLIRQMEGRIVDGVLTTKPIPQMVLPWNSDTGVPTIQVIRDIRVELEVTPTGAKGLIAGYADVETWYRSLITADATHHLSNGQISAPSLYKVLHRLADAYPDPQTGKNTAISSALDAEFTQVYIRHPEGEAAKAELMRKLKESAASTLTAYESGSGATN